MLTITCDCSFRFFVAIPGWLGDEDDCDSADTGELLTFRKCPLTLQEKMTLPTAVVPSGNNTARMKKAKKKRKGRKQVEKVEECAVAKMDETRTSRKVHTKLQRDNSGKRNTDTQSSCSETDSTQEKITVLPVVKHPSSESDSGKDDGDDNLDSTDSDSDTEYEALFSNVTRLEISLDHLQKIAEDTRQTSTMTFLSTQPEPGTHLTSTPANQWTSKKDTTPEEILAAILEEYSSEGEQGGKKEPRKCMWSAPLPPFQGTTGLTEGLKRDAERQKEGQEDGDGRVGGKQTVISVQQQTPKTVSGQKLSHPSECPTDSSKEEEHKEEEGTVLNEIAAPKAFKMVLTNISLNPQKAQIGCSSSCGEEEETNRLVSDGKGATTKQLSSSGSSLHDDENSEEVFSIEDSVKAPSNQAPNGATSIEKKESPSALLGGGKNVEQQMKANLRRLAAIQQRQKEAEQHRRFIRGALASLVGHSTCAHHMSREIVYLSS